MKYIAAPGILVPPDVPAIARAAELLSALAAGKLDYVRLVERRQLSSAAGSVDDVIVIEVDVERPQVVVNDVRRVEQIAIVLGGEDETYPEVLALREDFPEVPHLNYRYEEKPRSLCLYDRSWDEVKARWTAASFIERIRRWLADTAVGSLHREDQPLEQVLHGSGFTLLLPRSAITDESKRAQRLELELIPLGERGGTLIAQSSPQSKRVNKRFVASMFIAEPREHGIIRRAPRTLADLFEFVRSNEFDLLPELKSRLRECQADNCLDASLIIVVVFPLQRAEGTTIEVVDTWAFVTAKSVYDVGESVGLWAKIGGKVGNLIMAGDGNKGADITLDVLRPQFAFNRTEAAKANRRPVYDAKITVVGLGAIGSHIAMNAARTGFGRWTCIDEDAVMPHNLARHALLSNAVGWPKAVAVAGSIDALYGGEEPDVEAIVANVLRPGAEKDRLNAAIDSADLVVDTSASLPVARALTADFTAKAKRVSLFLSPRGSDLVCLAEDRERELLLDSITAQYCRAVIRDEALKDHLAANEARTRYARTCSDISFALPTHLVCLHGGIGANAVRAVHESPEAIARVWRANPETCAVNIVDIPLYPTMRASVNGWTMVIDRWLLDHLASLRQSRLPNETGGVLVGTYDLPRRTVHVVDTIHSPPDSRERPTLYIRGCEGLEKRVADVFEQTAGQLEYIGEWHSHPDGYGCAPSNDDLNLFANITDRMTAAGYPALMGIVGQHGQSRWFIGTADEGTGWQRDTAI